MVKELSDGKGLTIFLTSNFMDEDDGWRDFTELPDGERDCKPALLNLKIHFFSLIFSLFYVYFIDYG